MVILFGWKLEGRSLPGLSTSFLWVQSGSIEIYWPLLVGCFLRDGIIVSSQPRAPFCTHNPLANNLYRQSVFILRIWHQLRSIVWWTGVESLCSWREIFLFYPNIQIIVLILDCCLGSAGRGKPGTVWTGVCWDTTRTLLEKNFFRPMEHSIGRRGSNILVISI